MLLQPAPGARVKDKFVELPDELEEPPMERQPPLDLPSTVFEVSKLALCQMHFAFAFASCSAASACVPPVRVARTHTCN